MVWHLKEGDVLIFTTNQQRTHMNMTFHGKKVFQLLNWAKISIPHCFQRSTVTAWRIFNNISDYLKVFRNLLKIRRSSVVVAGDNEKKFTPYDSPYCQIRATNPGTLSVVSGNLRAAEGVFLGIKNRTRFLSIYKSIVWYYCNNPKSFFKSGVSVL